MRKFVMVVLMIMLASTILTGCGTKEKAVETTNVKPTVAIDIENYGVITIALEPDAAPITVDNFLKLVNENFYDGLTFHRIIDGFMMQGGDPLGTGAGGSDEEIKGEFKSNGVDNSLKHTKGAVSMARTLEPDSASSQFFIVDEVSSNLDGDYAVFGYVTDGIELVDKICAEVPVTDGNGTVEPANQPIITSIRVVE